MKRCLAIAMSTSLLGSLACSVFSSAPAQLVQPQPSQTNSSAPTDTLLPVKPDNPDTALTPPVTPTRMLLIPTKPQPTTPVEWVPATEEPTQGPHVFTESFDTPNANWSDSNVVTSQAAGHEPVVKLVVANGTMRFTIQDKETYVYSYFKENLLGETKISVNYEPRGMLTMGIAVVCRVNDERTQWYELRMVPSESRYNFYRFDRTAKAGGNPYELLGSGIVPVKDFAPARENTFSLTCSDSALTLDVNQGKRMITIPLDHALQGTTSGVGVMSYNEVPVIIDFKTIEIETE